MTSSKGWTPATLAVAFGLGLGGLGLAPLALAQAAPGAPPPAAAHAVPAPWWNPDWPLRRELVLGDDGFGSKPWDTAFAEIPTLGRVAPDGSDLRLLGPDGKHVGFEVLACGPDDRALIAWSAPDAARGTRYTLYFGNPKAGPPATPHEPPRAGLVLEARETGDFAAAKTWSEMEVLLAASPHVLGRWGWPHPQLGWNPFGPSEHVAYLFEGWLQCPKDGTYAFATNSVDASFAVVDSTVVCAWPGEHPGERRADHQGRIELKKGIHRLRYANSSRGHAACVLAWQAPGEPRLHPVPPNAFAGARRAHVGPAETRDGPVPDFEWSYASDLGLEGRPVSEVRFEALGAGRAPGVAESAPAGAPQGAGEARPAPAIAWDFGDGTTGAGPSPTHIFLEPGTFTVALTVDGMTIAQHVSARPRLGPAGVPYEKRIADYAQIVSGYRVDALSPAACLEMGLVCHEGGALEAAARGFRAALERGSLRLDGEDARWVERLAELYRDSGKYDDALRVCDLAIERARSEPGKRDEKWREVVTVRALAWKAALLYDDLDHAADAAACCREVLERHRRAPTDAVRWAFIRSGELALARGDADAARTILEEAQSGAEWKKVAGDFEVSDGAHSIDFEEYLREGDLDAASHELESWEWEQPTVLLGGLTRFLRGKVAFARKQPELAVRELERGLARDPRGSFADEALFLEGQAYEAEKNPEKARACWERLVRELPESSLAAQAKEKLR